MNSSVKILIADDEERWRRLVGDFLRNEGYKTVEAANGQEAVELIRQDSDISMAILDIMMPVMDGYVAQNKNIALSRQQILSAVWNFDYYGDARTVDTHVKNLRMKLGAHGAALKTVRGRGYKLEG